MLFEQVRAGGCLSYVIGCEETRAALVVDPELDHLDRYRGLCNERGLRIRYVVDTHTHADHFSAAREIAESLSVPAIMHRRSPAPHVSMRVDDGEMIICGRLRVRVLYSPGHTDDSICLVLPDRVLTGDTLLIGGTGRTDLPTGDPEALHESLFEKLLLLDDTLAVFPAHDYKGVGSSTLAAEKSTNPRLQASGRAEFVALMKNLDLAMPRHLTEALRTNRGGGKTVSQLIAEAAAMVPFISMEEVLRRVGRGDRNLVVLDVREKSAFDTGHIPNARHIPRGQLELRVDAELPDPTATIVTCCQLGKVSTLAAATLRTMGYSHVVALDGGMEAWKTAGYPMEPSPEAR